MVLMWVFTTDGFLSVVKHRSKKRHVIVRARFFEDLLPFARFAAVAIREDDKADYRYRVIVQHKIWTKWITQQASNIDYGNFKDAVLARQGQDRAEMLMPIWRHLLDEQVEAMRDEEADFEASGLEEAPERP